MFPEHSRAEKSNPRWAAESVDSRSRGCNAWDFSSPQRRPAIVISRTER
jgi:hypothetical protein